MLIRWQTFRHNITQLIMRADVAQVQLVQLVGTLPYIYPSGARQYALSWNVDMDSRPTGYTICCPRTSSELVAPWLYSSQWGRQTSQS